MSCIRVIGGRALQGEITLQGAKNSVLPILAGTVLCSGESVIHNCPHLSDVTAAINILRHLGAKVTQTKNTIIVNSNNITVWDIPQPLMREMRSSIVFLGAVAARCGRAELCSPGGCELGPRPIDLHLSSLREMGMLIEEGGGRLSCRTKNGLTGCDITLSFPSVGATENIMLAAVLAKGTTRILGAAKEPEIIDLARFLRGAGAKIYGDGTDLIVIEGVARLSGTEHTVIPDRIAAATYLSAAAITGGKISVKGVIAEHIAPILTVFKQAGCVVITDKNTLTLTAPPSLKRIPIIRTMPYPGFPTDAGSPIMAAMTLAEGSSIFVENIFENRFNVVGELDRLGAKIYINGRVAVIEGVRALTGAEVECTDLRGGAALVVAALAAQGQTIINKTSHIDRGYDRLCKNLAELGADIERCSG